jgi:hypothetical protein
MTHTVHYEIEYRRAPKGRWFKSADVMGNVRRYGTLAEAEMRAKGLVVAALPRFQRQCRVIRIETHRTIQWNSWSM